MKLMQSAGAEESVRCLQAKKMSGRKCKRLRKARDSKARERSSGDFRSEKENEDTRVGLVSHQDGQEVSYFL